MKTLQTILIILFLGMGQMAAIARPDGFPLTGAAAGDEFGNSVSISGDYAIVGAQGDNSYTGSAYIFVRAGDTWIQQAKLTASDATGYDYFGNSVSISGDYAIVGANKEDPTGISNAGSAYIFYRNEGSTDNWGQQAKLTASDAASSNEFGYSVSISGDAAIVGAYRNSHAGESKAGAAYIFEKPAGGWKNMQETVKLTASTPAENAYFGYSVSISGDTAIVGANREDSYTGSAYIFEKPGAVWEDMPETATLTASDKATNDQFGNSVSISGDTAIVGAFHDDSSTGSAYIFVRDGTSWSQQAKLTASDKAANDEFGRSVSINGDYAIVGAPYDDNLGSTYSFLRGDSSWIQKEKVTATNPGAGDEFGNSVSISGDYAIVGAYKDDSAYIYHSIEDLSLPVGLSSFTATVSGDDIILEWRTETEVNNLGFAIYRSEQIDGNYTEIAFVKGAGDSVTPIDYQFTDKKEEEGKTYFYYLEYIDTTGEKDRSRIIEAIASPIPKEFRLLQNFPNPFNPDTWLPYELAEDANVTICIYNIQGKLVRQLNIGVREADSYLSKEKATYWDGKDQFGEFVSSGLYFYTLKAGTFHATRKMVILK